MSHYFCRAGKSVAAGLGKMVLCAGRRIELHQTTPVIPSDLLQAISSPGGGRVSLVLGAGCSMEPPTNLPSARECSEEMHRQLIEDGILSNGDCDDPADLSCLADAVFLKTGRQDDLVDRFATRYNLKLAPPNEGYLIAAAMLCEGAISSIVTFNFDLALTAAVSQLGATASIGVIERPEDLARQKPQNVYYLHRNVNATNADAWILRTTAIQEEWEGHWEPIIATKVLTSPVVVFAGLGTPISVVVETGSLIRKALPETRYYQIDLCERSQSKFAQALQIEDSGYIKQSWSTFMIALSDRLVAEQIAQFEAAIKSCIRDNQLDPEDTTRLHTRLKQLGLVALGKARALWLLHDSPYCPDEELRRKLLADVFLAALLIARIADADLVVSNDGLLEYCREGRIVATYMLASGQGHRSRGAVEVQLEIKRLQFRGRAAPPVGAIVGGTSDAWTAGITPPPSVLLGDTADDIIAGTSSLPLYNVAELRTNSDICLRLVS